MKHRYFEKKSCLRKNKYFSEQDFPKIVKLPKGLVSSLEKVILKQESTNPVKIVINMEQKPWKTMKHFCPGI
ncbi:MAG: hypothetical protein PF689_08660 [Deltaproteobacteria bacterium]|jgi:hypothetical protein|nr:hypothetical protein [Deltaproteobacteria bacterium]